VLVVGLTGGIASGKSLVGERFAALGVPLADADAIAREVVAPGTEGLAAVTAAFGEAVLDPQGALDRGAMRRRIFSDDGARRALEEILHPRIRAEMDAREQGWRRAGHGYGIRVVPLLVESGQADTCDRVLVVDAPGPVQLARLRARDAMDEADARAMLERQCGRWERLRRADDVIANGDRVPPGIALDCQVTALDRKYRLLAR
jgi:dephospho-CoA kinase